MMESAKIELRSKKVRVILGNIPPKIIRYGMIVIIASFGLILLLASTIEYSNTYEIKAEYFQTEKHKTSFKLYIPVEKVNDLSILRDIFPLETTSGITLTNVQIAKVYDSIVVMDNNLYKIGKGFSEQETINGVPLLFDKQSDYVLKIKSREKTFLERILNMRL